MSVNPAILAHAGFIRRLMALVYDFFLLLGIAFAYGTFITLIKNLLGFDGLTPFSLYVGLVILAGLWLCCAFYYCWCWTQTGQTLGMKTWRIQLLTPEGKCLNWKQSFIRSLAASLCNGCFGLGLIWCLIFRRYALQDIFTGSVVIVLPKHGRSTNSSQ